ncbi:hypothetical protein NIES4070_54510 [Nostoc commune HK-02]|nr:hypothetical protein NIES4070_54510 [Nostoc commune HK-02]
MQNHFHTWNQQRRFFDNTPRKDAINRRLYNNSVLCRDGDLSRLLP